MFGARGTAQGNATSTLVSGVFGKAESSATTGVVVGVDGYAQRQGPTSDLVIGVRGGATDGDCCWGPLEWAGWFDGNVRVKGDVVYDGDLIDVSDQSLKVNVQPLSDPLGKVMSWSPKSYEFDLVNHPGIGLPSGIHYGMIAQEVESITPELVHDVVMDEETDLMGDILHASTTYKGLDYQEMIPILVGAVQELSAKYEQLESIVAGCCPVNDDGTNLNSMPAGGSDPAGSIRENKLMVFPNPVTDHTSIAYAMDHKGMLTMMVMGVNGQHVSTIQLGQADVGIFTYDWDTTSLAAGQYILSLSVNGEVEAVRVVKLEMR